MTTILTVRAMVTFKKKYRGQEINRGAKIKIGGAMPPAGDTPELVSLSVTQTYTPTYGISVLYSVK